MKRDSRFRRQHPAVNVLYLLGMLLVPAGTMHPALLFLSLIWASAYAIYFSGVSAMKPVILSAVPIGVFSMLLLPLFSHNGVTPLFYINGQAVTRESIFHGACMTGMLLGCFLWFQIWNQLIDSEKLLYLFGRILPTLGLLLSMVFRMVPMLLGRYREISDGQKGMGRISEELTFAQRISLTGKKISTLVSWSLEHSMEMALSMEGRGYGSGRRTFFHLFSYGFLDKIWTGALLFLYVLLGILGAKGSFESHYFPAAEFQGGIGTVLGLCLYSLAALAPFVWDVWNDRKDRR